MRAQNKPVIIVPFTNQPEKKPIMNLMLSEGATAFIKGDQELELLKTYDFNNCPCRLLTGYGTI
ncbi:hypothetical protein LDE04_14260 [Lactobacillus delbrueckii subsp. lactis]|nr:hypothetical protein LDE04_14260 [Lactobacillus delbrueckii subsp. lactis]